MAGQRIKIGGSAVFIDYHDGEGSAVVNGRTYRWEFHHFCGPSFLTKSGEFMKRQPAEHHPVWSHFEKWLEKYNEKRKTAKASEIVKV